MAIIRNCLQFVGGADGNVIDFTYQPFSSWYKTSQTQYASLARGSYTFPYSGGHAAQVTLPSNAIIKAIQIHKAAYDGNATAVQYVVGIGTAGSGVVSAPLGTCQTQAVGGAYDCVLDNIWFNVGTANRTVIMTAASGAFQNLTNTSFAIVEYF